MSSCQRPDAMSDMIGRRPIMVTGLALQALGFTWVAARGSLRTSWVELVIAVPTTHLGKAGRKLPVWRRVCVLVAEGFRLNHGRLPRSGAFWCYHAANSPGCDDHPPGASKDSGQITASTPPG